VKNQSCWTRERVSVLHGYENIPERLHTKLVPEQQGLPYVTVGLQYVGRGS